MDHLLKDITMTIKNGSSTEYWLENNVRYLDRTDRSDVEYMKMVWAERLIKDAKEGGFYGELLDATTPNKRVIELISDAYEFAERKAKGLL
ncbi:hypothetical protein [Xanthobacter autotrophicus]|uniref:hypothetical protein n=1 Tax=Xanthobacter autotrophicus TaxID=280 RepID=UPI003729EC2F